MYQYVFICHNAFTISLYRASNISRKKKQNFAGFSGGNSRKNRLISRDFHEKKVKIRGKNRRYPGFSWEKSQNSRRNRLILRDFRGRKVKIRGKIGRLHGILAEKHYQLSTLWLVPSFSQRSSKNAW